MSTEQHQAQAGWYVDPSDEARLRCIDGMSWTEHVAPAHPAPDPPDHGYEELEPETADTPATGLPSAEW